MKRIAILSIAVLMSLSALVLGGPYFGVENIGIVAAPEFICGADVDGHIGLSPWTFAADARYTDPDLLTLVDNWIVDLDFGVGWTQTASVNETGTLSYGCEFSVSQSGEFKPNAYPQKIKIAAYTVGLRAEGFVGPLTVWLGAEFPWRKALPTEFGFVPEVGFLVHW